MTTDQADLVVEEMKITKAMMKAAMPTTTARAMLRQSLHHIAEENNNQ